MSGELAPQPGSGLEIPDRPGDARDVAGLARKPAPQPEPSLVRVMITTLRLWLRRRVLRVADGASIGALRWTAVTAVVLVVAGAAGGGIAAAVTRSHPAPVRTQHHAPPPPRITPAQAETTANEQAAASWIVSQVAAGTTVACDPAMCGHLVSAGLPAAQQATIQSAQSVAAGSGLLVSTSVLRKQAGAQVLAHAPRVVAAFGTGAEAVQVRLLTTKTATAFRTALLHAIAAARKAGRGLSRNSNLHVSGTARRELRSGRVDPRLMVVLGRLATARSISVAGFSGAAPGASWPAQLRFARIDGLVRGSHRVNSVGAVLRELRRQHAPYRANLQELHEPGGGVAVMIEFPAPSPL